MKKPIIIIISVLLSSISFSQTNSELIYKISKECGKDLTLKIQHEEIEIKNALNSQNTLKITVLPIKNYCNEITTISVEVAKNISNIIQQAIKPQIPNFEIYKVEYSDIQNNNSDVDYFLKAQYQLNENNFLLYNINLEPNNKATSSIAFESISCEMSTDSLKKIDYPINAGKIIFIESDEDIFGQSNQIVSGQITTKLTESDFTIENSQEKAFFKIKVKAKAREHNNSFGVFFSYGDINIEIIDLKTGNAIFIKNYTQKGGSTISYNDAAKNAYTDIAGTISKEIIEKLSDYKS